MSVDHSPNIRRTHVSPGKHLRFEAFLTCRMNAGAVVAEIPHPMTSNRVSSGQIHTCSDCPDRVFLTQRILPSPAPDRGWRYRAVARDGTCMRIEEAIRCPSCSIQQHQQTPSRYLRRISLAVSDRGSAWCWCATENEVRIVGRLKGSRTGRHAPPDH